MKSIVPKRKVPSKRAKSEVVHAAEPAKPSPEIYFKIIGDQPVPVESSLGAMTLDQVAKKTKWDREALQRLHEFFFEPQPRNCRWLDDMMIFHATAIELQESFRLFMEASPGRFRDEIKFKDIRQLMDEVVNSASGWVDQILHEALIEGDIPSATNLLSRFA